MNETQRDEPTESKSAPHGELNFVAPRSFGNFPNALAQKLLLTFACFFPLVTGVERQTSDHFKFYALAIFSAAIAALLFREIWLSGFSLRKNRIARLTFFITILLSTYAAWLLELSVATFLIPVVFLAIIPILSENRLKDRLPRNVFIFLRWLMFVVAVCCFATTHQYTALGGDTYRKTGLATFGCCVLIFLATTLFFQSRDRGTTLESAMKWMLSSSFVVTLIGLLQFFQKNFMAGFFHDLLTDPRSIGT
ncbi:MAG TPA: hypothetical protein VFM25_06175, partial [Verrucomicrobiae bacterium]|nr:hypothetical protein [Verrucomicrobiae bacterium]